MDTNSRLVWALWGGLASVAVLAFAMLVGARQAPALGDPLEVGEPLPAVSLTGPEAPSPPVPSDSATAFPAGGETTDPLPTRTTEVVEPDAPDPVRVPAPDDDRGDDDDDDSGRGGDDDDDDD